MELCVLTLSEKFGKKCVVCYDINDNKLIRIVSKSDGTGISEYNLYGVSCLDIIDVDIMKISPIECQQENVIIDVNSIKKTNKKMKISLLQELSKINSGNKKIFGNTSYKLDNISNLNYSIEIIEFYNMDIYTSYNSNKTKANFIYNDDPYNNFSVTDSKYYGKKIFIPKGYAVITIPISDEFTNSYGYFKYLSAIYTI